MHQYEISEWEMEFLRVFADLLQHRRKLTVDEALFRAIQHYLQIRHYIETTTPASAEAAPPEAVLPLLLATMIYKDLAGKSTRLGLQQVCERHERQEEHLTGDLSPFTFREIMDQADIGRGPVVRLKCVRGPSGSYIITAPEPFIDDDVPTS